MHVPHKLMYKICKERYGFLVGARRPAEDVVNVCDLPPLIFHFFNTTSPSSGEQRHIFRHIRVTHSRFSDEVITSLDGLSVTL